MPTDEDVKVFGPVPDGVTHWGMLRLGQGSQPKSETLSNPDGNNVVVQRWPIDELSLHLVKARWGSGRFRTQWYSWGDDGKVRSGGQGAPFTLLPEAVEAASVAPPVDPSNPMAWALEMIKEARRDDKQRLEEAFAMAARLHGAAGGAPVLGHPGAPDPEVQRLREENAALLLRVTVREQIDAALGPVREEMAKKDAKIAELEREAEDTGPTFEPGGSIWESLMYAALNAAAKNPSIVSDVIGPIAERVAKVVAKPELAAPAAPPQQAPQPPPAAPRPRLVTFPQQGGPQQQQQRPPAPPVRVEPEASFFPTPSPIEKPEEKTSSVVPVLTPDVSRETPATPGASA